MQLQIMQHQLMQYHLTLSSDMHVAHSGSDTLIRCTMQSSVFLLCPMPALL
jgi:hypothetical protein